MRTQAFDDLACFAEWPLLPTLGGQLAALPPLADSALAWLDEDWAPECTAALAKLGLRCAVAP